MLHVNYEEACSTLGLITLADHCEQLTKHFFEQLTHPDSCRTHLIPPKHDLSIHLCHTGLYELLKTRTDFTDTRTALRFFYRFQFFSSFQLSLFPSLLVFLSKVSYLSHNRLFLDFYFFTFLVPFKTFLVLFSLCARLNWQLACQFSCANHLSYAKSFLPYCLYNFT